MRNTATLPIALSLGVLTVGAVLFYFRLRKKRTAPDTGVTFTFSLPNSVIPYVTGKNEETIREIEATTNTKITFSSQDNDNQICEIHGEPMGVEKASKLVREKAASPLVLTEEMVVPLEARGKILGHCGEMLEEMKASSGAKIWIESLNGDDPNKEVVKIEGTKPQINAAKLLINEKIKLVRPRITETPEPREVLPPQTESLRSDNPTGQMEVYVSAVVSPSKFFVQVLGKQSSELDLLVSEMTQYYTLEENRARHTIRNPTIGQLVAAKFEGDERWYRAKVVTIEPNPVSHKTVCDVFFPDYGDNLYVYPKDIFELQRDFLGLKFQAVECFLAYVKPLNPEAPDQWSQKSNDRFDELVHVAQWKRLLSKTITNRVTADGKQVPGVELYDIEMGRDIDIAQTLIVEGLAQRSTTGFFGDLLNSSVLKVDDGANSFPPLPKLSSSSIDPTSQSKVVSPEPITLNIKEVTKKTLTEESRNDDNSTTTKPEDKSNNNLMQPAAAPPPHNNNATLDFLSNERQQNGNGEKYFSDEDVVRQTLAEGEEAVKQWSDLLKQE